MANKVVILIAEDDAGHFELVKRNLWRSCSGCEIEHFKDGQEVLDYLFGQDGSHTRNGGAQYILLLDIRMPKVEGREVIRRIKEDKKFCAMPVIMLTTTDDSAEIRNCYELGCNFYVVKPADYSQFMQVVGNLGGFLSLKGLEIPQIA